jgi:hypothetical protein
MIVIYIKMPNHMNHLPVCLAANEDTAEMILSEDIAQGWATEPPIDVRIFWQYGDQLNIRSHYSKPGKGLSYPDMIVTAEEEGCSGSWDVYDAVDIDGNEVSFYGFSVLSKVFD